MKTMQELLNLALLAVKTKWKFLGLALLGLVLLVFLLSFVGGSDIRSLRVRAESGDVMAQHEFGRAYFNGDIVSLDYNEGVQWFLRAAEQGLAEAQMNLGTAYYNGMGVPKNDVEAVRWWRLAAEQENAVARHIIGFMYFSGQGVPQNYREAAKWYRLAADQGYVDAQFDLANAYYYGEGVAQDYSEAYIWYSLAAAGGHLESAQYRNETAEELSADELVTAQTKAERRYKTMSQSP